MDLGRAAGRHDRRRIDLKDDRGARNCLADGQLAAVVEGRLERPELDADAENGIVRAQTRGIE